ncbi:MAG: DUF4386 domain-containing protein [Chloroflexi bacterium]|nr:DUF4386 domain-containing protein [Chloroflexota bacterium]
MISSNAEGSPIYYARIAGFGYLIVFLFGIFANFFALEKIIEPGDAATTASNLADSELLFRIGIAGWIIVLVADAMIAWALYVLLEPANKSLSLLAAWFRLVFVAIFAVTLLYLFVVLELTKGYNATVFDTGQVQAQMTLFLGGYDYGINIAFVFFGLHISVLGYLVFKSDFIPKILGVLLMVASGGYLIDSFASFLSSEYADNDVWFLIFVAAPAIIAELSLTVWLLFKGVNVELWKKRAFESA